jgi:hypothetical protein
MELTAPWRPNQRIVPALLRNELIEFATGILASHANAEFDR